MTLIRVVNRTRGTMLGSRVRLADGLASRTRGFLFRPRPEPGEGILLSPCRAVHMFGVRFPLDVVFISERGLVTAVYPELAPWRRSALHGSALHALELPPGTIRATRTSVGDALSWAAAGGEAAGEAAGEAEDGADVVELAPRPAAAEPDVAAVPRQSARRRA